MQALWLAGRRTSRGRWLAILVIAYSAMPALATPASASEVLYGAGSEGDGGSPFTLYVLDPSTGAPLQTIGPVGFSVTGLAVDPSDGTLYGSTGRATGGGAPNPGSLIRIDRTTGAGTLIGDLRPDADTAGDLTFTPDGALFGWLVGPSSNDLVAIDKASGAATVVGPSGIAGNAGPGLASSPSGTLFHAALDDHPLYTVDRSTGAATPVATLTGTDGSQIGSLAFNAAGTLYGGWLDYSSTGPRPSRLITVDTATAAITFLGPSVSRLDAIVFAERLDRSVTLAAAKVKPKPKSKARSAGRKPLVIAKGKKVRFSGTVSSPQDQAGCGSNQPIQLQRRKPKKAVFNTFAELQTDGSGAFSAKRKLKKTFVYRALLGETLLCDTTVSTGAKVKVKKRRK